MNKPKIIAVVGMAGSGKSTVVDHLIADGAPKVYFGGVVLGEVITRGMEITQDNEKLVREDMRAKEGKDVIAKRVTTQVNKLRAEDNKLIILDGLYSWQEYTYLKNEFNDELIMIAVVAPRSLRYTRLASRAERPLTLQAATKRDYAEIENIAKGGPIALADYYILNNETLKSLQEQCNAILADLAITST